MVALYILCIGVLLLHCTYYDRVMAALYILCIGVLLLHCTFCVRA